MGSGAGAGEVGCFLAIRAPGRYCGDDGGSGEHYVVHGACGEVGDDGVYGGDGGSEHDVDYQIIPDCKLVSTIMGINSRLQVKNLIMFACLDVCIFVCFFMF